MNLKDFEPGMMVVHESWNQSTSDPLEVRMVDGKMMLYSQEFDEYTEPLAGGETEEGWREVES